MADVVIIHLLDETGKILIDSISAEYEDSFCLESFGELTKTHANIEPKDSRAFIIARVQSCDPKQPDKV